MCISEWRSVSVGSIESSSRSIPNRSSFIESFYPSRAALNFGGFDFRGKSMLNACTGALYPAPPDSLEQRALPGRAWNIAIRSNERNCGWESLRVNVRSTKERYTGRLHQIELSVVKRLRRIECKPFLKRSYGLTVSLSVFEVFPVELRTCTVRSPGAWTKALTSWPTSSVALELSSESDILFTNN